MLKEQWLLEAIQDAPDIFLLAGWAFASNDLNAFGTCRQQKRDKSLLINKAAPTALSINSTRANNPWLDSGTLLFDIYSGPFTENDQLTALPSLGSPRGLPP